jgi:hypothetical protein
MKPSVNRAGSTDERHSIAGGPIITPQVAFPALKIVAWDGLALVGAATLSMATLVTKKSREALDLTTSTLPPSCPFPA